MLLTAATLCCTLLVVHVHVNGLCDSSSNASCAQLLNVLHRFHALDLLLLSLDHVRLCGHKPESSDCGVCEAAGGSAGLSACRRRRLHGLGRPTSAPELSLGRLGVSRPPDLGGLEPLLVGERALLLAGPPAAPARFHLQFCPVGSCCARLCV